MKSFEQVNLFNINFHKVTGQQLIDYIVENVNANAINIAYELSWNQYFLNNSDLVFCDSCINKSENAWLIY